MKNLILVFVAVFGCLQSYSQITQGGSKKNWEKYSVIYDTTYTIDVSSSAYPSTSKFYLKYTSGGARGLMTEGIKVSNEGLFYGYTNGYEGKSGYNFNNLVGIGLGGYANWNNVNKNLHPSIDFSTLLDLDLTFMLPDEENSDYYNQPRFSSESTLGFAFSPGIGVVGTFKPFYLEPHISALGQKTCDKLSKFNIDLGVKYGLSVYTMGDIDYDYEENLGAFSASGYIWSEGPGARIDRTIILGFRYGLLGIRFDFSRLASSIARESFTYSEYAYSFGTQIDSRFGTIEEGFNHSYNKLNFMLLF